MKFKPRNQSLPLTVLSPSCYLYLVSQSPHPRVRGLRSGLLRNGSQLFPVDFCPFQSIGDAVCRRKAFLHTQGGGSSLTQAALPSPHRRPSLAWPVPCPSWPCTCSSAPCASSWLLVFSVTAGWSLTQRSPNRPPTCCSAHLTGMSCLGQCREGRVLFVSLTAEPLLSVMLHLIVAAR